MLTFHSWTWLARRGLIIGFRKSSLLHRISSLALGRVKVTMLVLMWWFPYKDWIYVKLKWSYFLLQRSLFLSVMKYCCLRSCFTGVSALSQDQQFPQCLSTVRNNFSLDFFLMCTYINLPFLLVNSCNFSLKIVPSDFTP